VEEINTVARALFEHGAERVLVWDNHGGGGNLPVERLDPRLTPVQARGDTRRGDFAKGEGLVGVIFLGYHAKEGTPNGVLAHTFNSVAIQYAKLNGEPIGELYADSRIFAAMGIKPMLHAGDDVSVREMNLVAPEAVTVITKYGRGRNAAELIDTPTVLARLYDGVQEALGRLGEPIGCPFPVGAELQVRYTRAETAAAFLEKARADGIEVRYGEDTHILHAILRRPTDIPFLL
jgi:D-amino peptidase